MNWCQPHYDKLKDAIKERGLWNLVGNGAQDAKDAIEGKRFDPLLWSWASINSFMLQSPGLNGRILTCPFCILVDDGQPELVDKWLAGCLDDCYKAAIESGAIKHS